MQVAHHTLSALMKKSVSGRREPIASVLHANGTIHEFSIVQKHRNLYTRTYHYPGKESKIFDLVRVTKVDKYKRQYICIYIYNC